MWNIVLWYRKHSPLLASSPKSNNLRTAHILVDYWATKKCQMRYDAEENSILYILADCLIQLLEQILVTFHINYF